jgi:hypothetical protein
MTHEQLAQAVGAARETISLIINELSPSKFARSTFPQSLVVQSSGADGRR